MRIQFNTDRPYTEHGQRIVALYDSKGVIEDTGKPTIYFEDHDRSVQGVVRLEADHIGTSARDFRATVMVYYDHNDYEDMHPDVYKQVKGALQWAKRKTWYFTFGTDHLPGLGGYVKMEDMTFSEARRLMVLMVGDKFCGQYDQSEWDEVLDLIRPTMLVRTLTREDLPSNIQEDL